MEYLSDKQVKDSNKWLKKTEKAIFKKCSLCFLLSDPTRLKIMLALQKHKELCVSDLAKIIGLSISAISHQLDKLEKLDAVTSRKTGQNVCYGVNSKNPIAHCFKSSFLA
ncbi:MAG: winged helix-turn-helix domain-containing protein [Patescibacteria group bacterium]